MPGKKRKPKAKPNRKLSQRERFVEAARLAEADETGGIFKETFGKIVRPKGRRIPGRQT